MLTLSIVEDFVQVPAQGCDNDDTKRGEFPCPAEQAVQWRASAPVEQIAADAPVFVEQIVDECVRLAVPVTKKGTAGPGPADSHWVYTAATVVDTRDFFTKYPAILSNPDLDLSAGCPSDAFAGADPAAGPALQEDCVLSALSDANRTVDDPDPVPYLAQRVVGDPVPCHAQRAIEARIPDPVPEVAPVSVERIVQRVVTPSPDGQIIDHRDPAPADQVVERVIRALCYELCVQVPVPQEVSSTRGVAADANVEQNVDDSVQVPAQVPVCVKVPVPRDVKSTFVDTGAFVAEYPAETIVGERESDCVPDASADQRDGFLSDTIACADADLLSDTLAYADAAPTAPVVDTDAAAVDEWVCPVMGMSRRDFEARILAEFAARPVLSPAEDEANRLAALHGLDLPFCPRHCQPACGCYGVVSGDDTPTPRRRRRRRR